MSGLFSLDGPVGRCLARLTDLLTVSVLWMICSLPVVTMGASTAALYTMTLRMVRGEEGKIAAGFFQAFRENFKKATVVHLLLTVLLVLLAFYWTMVGILPEGMRVFFYGVSLLFTVLWLMEAMFIYPVLARFENTIWSLMKNAWLMAAGQIHLFVLAVIITGLPVWTFLLNTALFVQLLPLWILLGPGLSAWLNSFLFHHCFKRYIPDENEEEE